MKILQQWRERRRYRKVIKKLNCSIKQLRNSTKRLGKTCEELGNKINYILYCYKFKGYKGMGTTKSTKVWLIAIGFLLVLDVFTTVNCFASGVSIHTSLNGVLNCVNLGILLWFMLYNNRLELRNKELQMYKDNILKYHGFQFDKANENGSYEIIDWGNAYIVAKSSDDCFVFFVKVFPFDPSDENSEAEAKSKAEELLNLITENGKLWQ